MPPVSLTFINSLVDVLVTVLGFTFVVSVTVFVTFVSPGDSSVIISISLVVNDVTSLEVLLIVSVTASTDGKLILDGNSIGSVSPSGNCKFGSKSPTSPPDQMRNDSAPFARP